MIQCYKNLAEMNKAKINKIELLAANMLHADNGIFMFKKDFKCVGCGAILREGRNIHRGFHLNVCKSCRQEYFNYISKTLKITMEKQNAKH
jgi:hypothetical protein